MTAEEWRDIKDFPGYQVSNYGEVRSFWNKTGWTTYEITNDWHYMSPHSNNMKPEHYQVLLSRNGIKYRCYIHRLVAEAFIPNPNHYPIVRHMDDDPANCCVWNLAWGTQKDNVDDMIAHGRARYNPRNGQMARRVPVDAFDKNSGEFIGRFESQSSAAKYLKINYSHIGDCVQGYRNSVGGYKFRISEVPNV